jgi:hypothetical protein
LQIGYAQLDVVEHAEPGSGALFGQSAGFLVTAPSPVVAPSPPPSPLVLVLVSVEGENVTSLPQATTTRAGKRRKKKGARIFIETRAFARREPRASARRHTRSRERDVPRGTD